jgi:purine nucleoside permease
MAKTVSALVITMFEGEVTPWRDNYGFDEVFPFPEGGSPLLYDSRRRVLCMVTGVGSTTAAAAVMALGKDDRFDLSEAYILIAGIAGGNPFNTSLGSVVWSEWVIDADLAQEIDPREMPSDWSTGRIPLFRRGPFEAPPGPNRGEARRLNAQLRDWAVRATESVALHDVDPGLLDEYANFSGFNAVPCVLRGEVIAGSTMWHGSLLNAWATEWVRYWTEGHGEFMTTSMEDAGSVTALTLLAAAGRIDFDRVLLLRSVCNYSMQPARLSAAQSLTREGASAYSAFRPAAENAYRVGAHALNQLIS